MKTWSPLWSSILNSTVWAESKEVRLLWITILAMKDKDGMVESSLIGLARQAGLTIEETREAIVVLESPDEKSETFLEGGWIVLNHKKYRDEIGKLKQRQQQAEWQRKYRERQKANNEIVDPAPKKKKTDKEIYEQIKNFPRVSAPDGGGYGDEPEPIEYQEREEGAEM
jgi:hypothetical protein